MTLVDAALGYAAQGWSVIPVQPGSKSPLVPWTEYHERRATEEEIRSWWKRSPNAGVGIVTGKVSNLVVVDIDAKRGLNIKDLMAKDPCNFVVKTGSGGYHLYYQYPSDLQHVPNQVNNEGRDVRADGGFVVAPPSLHSSGKRYEWVRGDEKSPLTSAPAFVRHGRNGTAPSTNGTGDRWISEILKGVSSGGRNDAATRLAGYYVSRKMAPDVVLGLLTDWNQKNNPPLSDRELEVIVDSVQRTSERKSRTIPASSIPGEAFGLLRLSEYMAKYGAQEVEWLIEDWMPDKTVAMAVAPPGSYKTWLELDLAVAVSTPGFPFLGTFPVRKNGPVIIVQQEDFHGQMAERLGTIIESHFDMGMAGRGTDSYEFSAPPDPPIYLHPDRRLRFKDSTVMQGLEEKVAALRPVLVIIDPLYSTGDTDDYMASTVNDMFALKEMRDKYGCSFFFAHHTKKSSETSSREDSWGSQFLNAFIETGWQVRPKDKPGQVMIRRHFKVRPNIEEALLTFDIQTDKVPYHYAAHLKSVKTGEVEVEGPSIKELLAEKAMTLSEISRRLEMAKSTVSKRLTALQTAGEVARDLHGAWSLVGESVV